MECNQQQQQTTNNNNFNAMSIQSREFTSGMKSYFYQ